jgi:hypothetical protein
MEVTLRNGLEFSNSNYMKNVFVKKNLTPYVLLVHMLTFDSKSSLMLVNVNNITSLFLYWY